MVTCEQCQVSSGTDLEVHRDRGSLEVCRLGPETVAHVEEWGREIGRASCRERV